MNQALAITEGVPLTNPATGGYIVYFDSNAANDATLEVVSAVITDPDQGEPVVRIIFGTVTDVTTAYFLVSDGVNTRRIVIDAPETDDVWEGDISLIEGLGDIGLFFRVMDRDGSDRLSKELGRGDIEVQQTSGETVLAIEVPPAISPVLAGETRLFLTATDGDRFFLTAAVANRADAQFVYRIGKLAGTTFTPIGDGSLSTYYETPQGAVVSESNGATEQMVIEVVASAPGEDDATAYSAPITVQRTTASPPSALSLTGANVDAVWVDEGLGQWRDTFDWTGLGVNHTTHHFQYTAAASPSPEQCEPILQRQGLANTDGITGFYPGPQQNPTAGVRTVEWANLYIRYRAKGTGVWSAVTANIGENGSDLVVQPAATGAVPVVIRNLDNQTYEQGTGDQTIDASIAFSGADITYSVSGSAAVSINASTGAITVDTASIVAGATITVTATNGNGSANTSFTLTVQEEVTDPDPGTASVPSRVKLFVNRNEYDVEEEHLGGEINQTSIGCAFADNYRTQFFTGDTNGAHRKLDGFPYHPIPGRGFFGEGGVAAAIHPVFTNRWFAQPNSTVNKNDGVTQQGGLFMSRDEGFSWTRVISADNTRGPAFMWSFKKTQWEQHLIDFSPINPLVGWCILQQKAANFGNQGGDRYDWRHAALYRTDNGGLTWQPRVAWNASNPNTMMNSGPRSGGSNQQNLGFIYTIHCDPLAQNRVWLGTESGLFQADNPTGEGSFVRRFGGWAGSGRGAGYSSVLDNRGCRKIRFVNSKTFFTIDHDGLYFANSLNLLSATRIFNPTQALGKDYHALNFEVSPVNDQNMWMFFGSRENDSGPDAPNLPNGNRDVHHLKRQPPIFTTNRFSSYTECDDDFEGVGNILELSKRLNGAEVLTWPDGFNARTVWVHRGNILSTRQNRGSGTGTQFLKDFNGWNGASGYAVALNPDTPANIHVGVADRFAFSSENYGRTFNLLGNGWRGSNTPFNSFQNNIYATQIVAVPTSAPGNNGVHGFVAGNGTSGGNNVQLVRFWRQGGVMQFAYPNVAGVTGRVFSSNGFCNDVNPEVIYFGPYRSDNYGIDDYVALSGPGVRTASWAAQGRVWGVSGNEQPQFQTNGNYGSGGWQNVAPSSGWINADLTFGNSVHPSPNPHMAAHPTNSNLCLVTTSGEAYMLNRGASGAAQRQNLGLGAHLQSLYGRRLWLGPCAIDYNDPDILYVALKEFGGYPPLWRSIDGGSTWEDISGQIGASTTIASGINASTTTIQLDSGTGSTFATRGVAVFGLGDDDEAVSYIRVGDTLTAERGFWERDAVSHSSGATITDLPRVGYVPCFDVQDMKVHPKDGTLVVTMQGKGWYVVAPPEGYTAANGFSAGELFDRVQTAEDFA